MQDWNQRNEEIAQLARRQLFFVGGAPRSGTTWLQQLLDCHPDICCRGEGLFRVVRYDVFEQELAPRLPEQQLAVGEQVNRPACWC